MQNWTRRDGFILRDGAEGPNGMEWLGWVLFGFAACGLQGLDQTWLLRSAPGQSLSSD